MKIYNTGDSQIKPSVVMLLYGAGGVGKTTFASTAPKPILADVENGAKYFGLRGIKIDVALINNWKDIEQFYLHVKEFAYETVVIDPIGELMEKLKAYMLSTNDNKLVMKDGSPTMAGWGWMKDKMRNFVKSVRDLNKHMILIAHVEEKDDEGRLVKRPKIMTKISEDLIGIVDIVGYMDTMTVNGDIKRLIRVQPSERFEAKDRTNQLGPIIEADFSKIVKACQGTETFKWSKQPAGSPKIDASETPAVELPKDTPVDKKATLRNKINQKKTHGRSK